MKTVEDILKDLSKHDYGWKRTGKGKWLTLNLGTQTQKIWWDTVTNFSLAKEMMVLSEHWGKIPSAMAQLAEIDALLRMDLQLLAVCAKEIEEEYVLLKRQLSGRNAANQEADLYLKFKEMRRKVAELLAAARATLRVVEGLMRSLESKQGALLNRSVVRQKELLTLDRY